MAGDTLLTIGELARLTGLTVKTIRSWSDTDFRASLRRAAAALARAVAELGQPSAEANQDMATLLRERVAIATDAGIERHSAEARPVVDELAAAYARHTGRTDGPQFRSWLLELLAAAAQHHMH